VGSQGLSLSRNPLFLPLQRTARLLVEVTTLGVLGLLAGIEG